MKNDKNIGINMDIIRKHNLKVVSTKEALKDVTPIQWSESVKNGSKKVIVSSYKR